MLNLTKEDFKLFETCFKALEDIAFEAADWQPTIIMVCGNEKVVISYGESGDPCITEAYDVNDRMKDTGLATLFRAPSQDVH